MLVNFSKYSGCGNDFVLVDNRTNLFPISCQNLIAKLCHRRFGIGADGVILLEKSLLADMRMRIFNPDGQEAEMCGNGIRCLVNFAHAIGLKQASYRIETMQRVLLARRNSQNVSVEMGEITPLAWHQNFLIEGRTYSVHHIDSGVPHLVWFCQNIEEVNLETLGFLFRHHSAFSPQGVNFNVAQIIPIESDGGSEIAIRTYERGVEGETLACGTGCTAVAAAAGLLYGLKPPITLRTRGGSLLIDFSLMNGRYTDIVMYGEADCIFNGIIRIDHDCES